MYISFFLCKYYNHAKGRLTSTKLNYIFNEETWRNIRQVWKNFHLSEKWKKPVEHKKVTYSIFMKMYSIYYLVTLVFLKIFSLWFRFKSIVLIYILKLNRKLIVHLLFIKQIKIKLKFSSTYYFIFNFGLTSRKTKTLLSFGLNYRKIIDIYGLIIKPR